jgi:hypothetical protein
MRKNYHPSAKTPAALEQTWAKAWADWRKANEEKARVIAAMLAAGRQQHAREASK